MVVCPAIQVTEDNGFAASWQPAAIGDQVLERCAELAYRAVSAFPGLGVFAVELLVVGGEVLISEVTPRVVSAGFVTLASGEPSVFALQARAILGLPVSMPVQVTPSAARALWAEGSGKPVFSGLAAALSVPATRVLLFGKPKATRRRCVGVVVASAPDAETARDRADVAAAQITVALDDGRVADLE
jgi:phosphoribosylglycinamide formyltransferase 2